MRIPNAEADRQSSPFVATIPTAKEPMQNLLFAAPMFRRTSVTLTLLSFALLTVLALLS